MRPALLAALLFAAPLDVPSGLSAVNKDLIAERGAWIARRDDRACREHVREEQRSEPGCPAREVVLDQRGQATDMERPCQISSLVDASHSFNACITGDSRSAESRRLITLIFAGRNRIIVIRRELSRTRGAGRATGSPHSRGTRVLLSVCLSTATPGCVTPSPYLFLFLSRCRYAARRGDWRSCCSTVTPMAQMKPKSSRATAVTACCFDLPRPTSLR